MTDPVEEPLAGGFQTPGVVRVGDTVRRPLHARSEYVHAVLRHLEAVGFDGAPRLLGIDDEGREMLSYLDGATIVATPARLSDARLRSAGRLIRRFHDATAGTPLASGEEVVCHNELGPHNTVFRGDEAIGLIDWDEYVAPGPRLIDLGHAVWCFADVGEEGGPVAEQARRVRLLCDAYGWHDAGAVIDEIAHRLRWARDDHARAGREAPRAVFEGLVAWMDDHAPALKAGSR